MRQNTRKRASDRFLDAMNAYVKAHSQAVLAEKAETSQPQISLILAKKRWVTRETFDRVASVIGFPAKAARKAGAK